MDADQEHADRLSRVAVEGGECISTAKHDERCRAENHGYEAEGRRNQHKSHQLSRTMAVHAFKKAIESQAQAYEDDRPDRLGKHAPTVERLVAEDTGRGGGSVVANERLRRDIKQ